MEDQHLAEIVGESPALKRMLKLAMQVAPSNHPVLILGEAGSGKELIARAIHRIGARKNESFVKVNCTPTADGLLASDLFGQEDGSGNGQKIGHLEQASQGTLLLDEIAHIPLSLQDRLLRLLERGEFERLGGTQIIPANIRLIAITKYDLGERVAKQMFRDELYDRLNVFPIQVPPLRERRDDIPLLVRYFVQKFGRRKNKCIVNIPDETMSSLMQSDWPGNVRELENLIEWSVVLTDGPALRVPIALSQLNLEAETG
jgi:formate hydrogenlyase transcriptional activator